MICINEMEKCRKAINMMIWWKKVTEWQTNLFNKIKKCQYLLPAFPLHIGTCFLEIDYDVDMAPIQLQHPVLSWDRSPYECVLYRWKGRKREREGAREGGREGVSERGSEKEIKRGWEYELVRGRGLTKRNTGNAQECIYVLSLIFSWVRMS